MDEGLVARLQARCDAIGQQATTLLFAATTLFGLVIAVLIGLQSDEQAYEKLQPGKPPYATLSWFLRILLTSCFAALFGVLRRVPDPALDTMSRSGQASEEANIINDLRLAYKWRLWALRLSVALLVLALLWVGVRVLYVHPPQA